MCTIRHSGDMTLLVRAARQMELAKRELTGIGQMGRSGCKYMPDPSVHHMPHGTLQQPMREHT